MIFIYIYIYINQLKNQLCFTYWYPRWAISENAKAKTRNISIRKKHHLRLTSHQLGALKQLSNAILQWNEGNVLFNDALNTFYLWLYGIRHMVKDHSDSERGNQLPPHRLFFPISSRRDSTYHSLCYPSRGALAGMRNSPMSPPHEGSI